MTKYNGVLSAVSISFLIMSMVTSMYITGSLLLAVGADRLLWFLFWTMPVQLILLTIFSAMAKED